MTQKTKADYKTTNLDLDIKLHFGKLLKIIKKERRQLSFLMKYIFLITDNLKLNK